LTRFNEPSKCDCQSESGCSNCKILLVLDSGESEQTRAVLSSELSSEDDTVKPVVDKIPIVQLAPGQKIKVECYARLGRGTEHAKWNSSNISTLTDTDKDDEKILTVESTGALNPEQIVLEGVQEVSKRVVEFKDMINKIEE
jgi:DNA-directed RNA polymerase subunit D